MATEHPKTFWAGAALASLAPLLGYLLTLCPWLFWRDAPEFSMVPFLLDISHPPGSPTYALLGKLVSFLPLGSVAFRANLLSALFGSAASLAVYLLSVRMLGLTACAGEKGGWREPLTYAVAAGVAGLFAFAAANWYWAVVAEVYTLHLLLVAAGLYFAVRYLEPRGNGEGDRPAGHACLSVFLVALGAGVHPNLILFLPGLTLFFLLTARGRLNASETLLVVLFLFLGLSVFLYLPVRSATHLVYDHGNPETMRQLVDHLTARAYAERLYHYPWSRILEHWAGVPRMIAGQIGFPALLLGGFGIVILLWRRLSLALLLLLLAAANLWLVKDWTAAFGYLPVLLVWSLLAGIGVVELVSRGLRRLEAGGVALTGRGLTLVLVLLACLVALLQARAGWATADKHGHWLAGRHGKAALDCLPEGSILVSAEDHLSYAVHYLQYVENYRTDVAHIHQAYLPYRDALLERWPELDWGLPEFPEFRTPLAPLLAQMNRHPVFLDRSERTQGFVPIEWLVPYGIVFQVMPEPTETIDEPLLGRHAAVYNRFFQPILSNPWFNPHDWTAREVYASIHNGFGEYFFRRGYPALSELSFQSAKETCPECSEAYGNLVGLYIARQDLESARRMAEEGLALFPDNANLLANLGLLYERGGDADRAVTTYRRALVRDPSLDRARLSLAKLLLSSGRGGEAVPEFRFLWERASDHDLRLRAGTFLAAMLYERGNRERAREILSVILAEEPEHEEARALLSQMESGQER